MIIQNCQQGSAEWLALRTGYLTASEAPAMLGISKYQTRTDLLKQKSLGIAEEVSANTQALFDRGHAAEAAARPIAERIIGEDLFPATVTEEVDGLPLLASLDGMTMAGDILFEHKLWSESLAEAVRKGELSAQYTAQMDQQLLVTGAEKVLFMCSDGTEERCAWMWYFRNEAAENYLTVAWHNFRADLANYQHVAPTEQAIAEHTESLPAVSVRMDGAIAVVSNLDLFGEKLAAFIDGIDKNPSTDQSFANCESAIKTLAKAEEALDHAESNAIAQIEPVESMRRVVADYKNLARTTRLMLDKLVKSRKESIRVEIQQGAVNALRDHYNQINATLRITLGVPADFGSNVGAAMKGKKTVASLRGAADDAVATAKIKASQDADRVRINLQTLDAHPDYTHLFPDVAQIAVTKAADDFKAVVTSRIAEHKAEQERKQEADRQRIREEERAKVEAEERAKYAAKIKADADLALELGAAESAAAARRAEDQRGKAADESKGVAAPQPSTASTSPIKKPEKATRPTDAEIIEVLTLHYRVHESKVIEWILDMDLNAASEKMLEAM